VYTSSNYFHIGINGTDIGTGGINHPLLVFVLIQNRNNLSPFTFSSSLISFPSFPHIGATTAAKHPEENPSISRRREKVEGPSLSKWSCMSVFCNICGQLSHNLNVNHCIIESAFYE
jgi:hypothetical protein